MGLKTIDVNKKNYAVYIINGYGGCGKSSFIKYCKEYCDKYTDNIVIELSTIDWPKQVAQYCGMGNKKTEEDRRLLKDLKDALERFDGSPSNKVIEKIQQYYNLNLKNCIFFVNIREPDKIEEFKEKTKKYLKLNCKTILILNPNIKPIISNDADKYVTYYKEYDLTIENRKELKDLKDMAKRFIREFYKCDLSGELKADESRKK